ncbi:hypothetical protein H2200_001108 [Cladophialophora chaetospira]|uniref:Alpha/beta hydrolase fold-3 domain-containing protein n=1 Tax=Cladophialophora chaetospira TaxID=386627 RepID=A0AA38XK97_9EURO|nr:hypothetical protein H2200_001108 [Cladophialophora chaetospira]
MASLVKFVRYLRLKIIVSLFRLAVRLFSKSAPPKPDSVLRIPSRDTGRTIKAHLYKPSGDDTRNGRPYPVLINFCGSGFALHLHGLDDPFCRFVAANTGYTVLDIEYRLGPEHPFPAAVNDVEDAIKYVLDRPAEYKASHLSVSGFSSGGTLALVAPTLFPPGTLQSVIAFYPATDLASDPSLRKPPAPNAKPRSVVMTKLFRKGYIGDMDPRDPRISPAYANTNSYPQRMLVVTAELDSSALEAEELAERAKTESVASGREVVLRRMKGCGHAFDKRNKDQACASARDEAYGLAVDMLRKITSQH